MLAKYFDYSNVFSVENATELPKNIRINEYIIKLKKGKQSLFGSIYSLRQIKLEILKNYIEISLVISFIQSFKSPIRASILFNRKPNRNFYFYIKY